MVLALQLDGPPSVDKIPAQYPGADRMTIGGHLLEGTKDYSKVQVRFTDPGIYTLEFHSLMNFWGRGDDWTGGYQSGMLSFEGEDIPIKLELDSVYLRPWYSYSPIVKSRIGSIRVREAGIHEIAFSGIEFYRGYNTGPNHHTSGLKLHFIEIRNNELEK